MSRNYIKLRNEGRVNFSGGYTEFFINPEIVTDFSIRYHFARGFGWEPLDDLCMVVFYSGRRCLGCATIYGRDRAEQYARSVTGNEHFEEF